MIRLSPAAKSAIILINSIYPECFFGGSISLNVCGFLNREIGDIDVFMTGDLKYNKLIIEADDMHSSIFNSDFLGCKIDREAFKINGVKVCFFKVPKYLLQGGFTFEIDKTLINIQNPIYAITAKMQYFTDYQKLKEKGKSTFKYDKHIKDLDLINKKLLQYE